MGETRRKFTDDQVRQIRKDFEYGQKLLQRIVPITKIAEKYGVSPQHCTRFYAGVNVRALAELSSEERGALWKELHEHYELEREYKPYSGTDIAKKHGVSPYTIQRIAGYRSYSDIPKDCRKVSKDEAIALAMKLIPEGRCTDNVLSRHGVSKSGVMQVIRKAEARYVNEAMRMFPAPPRYEELGYE